MGNGIDNRIEPGESEDDSNYINKSRNYSIPQSLDKQANTGQNGDILLESNQAVTLSETLSEPGAPTALPESPIEPSRSKTPSFEPS